MFASQQSNSQGFIEDSHLELFLRNAYNRHTSSCMCVGNNSAYP
ncbi:OprD family porin, partial [Klebsiella pneumoniae]|nr:OprD family porin [Klebsiella pneumoniae]